MTRVVIVREVIVVLLCELSASAGKKTFCALVFWDDDRMCNCACAL